MNEYSISCMDLRMGDLLISATCAAYVGCAATVCDGSRSAASAGWSRHGEHPGVRVSVAQTFIVEVFQRPRFAESDVQHWRMTT